MPVEVLGSTLPGGFTVVCEHCGGGLGQISEIEYLDSKAYYDVCVCSSCDPSGKKMAAVKQLQANINKKGRADAPLCAHCQKPADLMTGRSVYPHRRDLMTRAFWVCECGARCGTHKHSPQYKPLGTPANESLRSMRKIAHAAFDPLWERKMAKDCISKTKARQAGYAWLAEQLGIPVKKCHIGQMDAKQCCDVIELCKPYLKRAA